MAPRFVLSLFDPRELVLPFTVRRAVFFGIYTIALANAWALERYFEVEEKFAAAMRWQNFVLMGRIYGLEPALLLPILALASYPEAAPRQPTQESIQVQWQAAGTEETAYVMPCYNRDADSLSCTIQAPLRPFKQEQIIVVENANAAHRRTGTRQVSRDIETTLWRLIIYWTIK